MTQRWSSAVAIAACALGVGATLSGAPPAAAAGRLPILTSCGAGPSTTGGVRPATWDAGCVGASFRVRSLRWSSWTPRSGTARGVTAMNDCDPDCASGAIHAYPVRVTVSRPRSCAFGKEYGVPRLRTAFLRVVSVITMPDGNPFGEPAGLHTFTDDIAGCQSRPAVMAEPAVSPVVRPARIDGTTWHWTGLSWSSWSAVRAHGRGSFLNDSDDPSLVWPVRITLRNPIICSGIWQFTEIGSEFTGQRPAGYAAAFTTPAGPCETVE